MTSLSNFAAESGHWYKPDGTPAYTVVGKNGNERPTTLRDARTMGLLPSVTTIIRCAAAPGLERYKLRQLAESMATLPKPDGESWDDFIVRAVTDSKEHSKQAAARGEEIHAAIERHYREDLRVPDSRHRHHNAGATGAIPKTPAGHLHSKEHRS